MFDFDIKKYFSILLKIFLLVMSAFFIAMCVAWLMNIVGIPKDFPCIWWSFCEL